MRILKSGVMRGEEHQEKRFTRCYLPLATQRQPRVSPHSPYTHPPALSNLKLFCSRPTAAASLPVMPVITCASSSIARASALLRMMGAALLSMQLSAGKKVRASILHVC
jgi:hypothetical protein